MEKAVRTGERVTIPSRSWDVPDKYATSGWRASRSALMKPRPEWRAATSGERRPGAPAPSGRRRVRIAAGPAGRRRERREIERGGSPRFHRPGVPS